MKTYQKNICLLLAVLLLPAFLLAGCGKREDPFQVIFAGPFVNEKLAASYGEGLAVEGPIQYSGFSFGSEEVDAMVYGAGAMMMNAMVAAGEVDVMVCDLENATRLARGGTFLDLTTAFTEEELAGRPLLSFDLVDEYGNLTGEKTPPCGLDLTGHGEIDYILGGGGYGLFIVSNTGDLERSKEVFRAIVNS